MAECELSSATLASPDTVPALRMLSFVGPRVNHELLSAVEQAAKPVPEGQHVLKEMIGKGDKSLVIPEAVQRELRQSLQGDDLKKTFEEIVQIIFDLLPLQISGELFASRAKAWPQYIPHVEALRQNYQELFAKDYHPSVLAHLFCSHSWYVTTPSGEEVSRVT